MTINNASIITQSDDKSLSTCSIREGNSKIFIEHRDEDAEISEYVQKIYFYSTSAKTGKQPKSYEEINRQRNTLTIKYTDLDSKEAKYSVTVKKTDNAMHLKQLIADKLELDTTTFKLMKTTFKSYLNLNTTLRSLKDGEILKVKSGVSCGYSPFIYINISPGQIVVNASLFHFDDDEYSFFDGPKVILDENMTIIEAKEVILEKYNEWRNKTIEKQKAEAEAEPETKPEKKDEEEKAPVSPYSIKKKPIPLPDLSLDKFDIGTDPNLLRLRTCVQKVPQKSTRYFILLTF